MVKIAQNVHFAKRVCILCDEDSEEQDYYTDNGVDFGPYICEFCYLNLRKVIEQ